jgi:1-aminocyclopropane-1-carboxylate deaminase
VFLKSKNRRVVSLENQLFKDKKLKVLVQIDQSLYDQCSGNKWWKLKYNLLEAKEKKYTSVLTFGGAFSNHILAVSKACQNLGISSIGIIRGDEIDGTNSTLSKARQNGMKLNFIDRATYRDKENIDWNELYKNCYIIPEGGTNQLAVEGCKEFLITNTFDYVCCSVGTGGTISGIINSLTKDQFAIGFSALKNGYFLENKINEYVESQNWSLNHDFHFNGYAKMNKELVDFMNDFKKTFQISLDPVYTSKLFYGVFKLIEQDFFEENNTILIVHSGGLQAIQGMNQKIQSKQWYIE